MTTKLKTHCNICGKTLQAKGNCYNQWIIEHYFDLKCIFHCVFMHGIRIGFKGWLACAKRIFKLLLFSIVQIAEIAFLVGSKIHTYWKGKKENGR